MSSDDKLESILLKIPSKPEYVGVARLTILGIACRMNFSYDVVEDLKLAVGEACTAAVERAQQAGTNDSDITINCHMSDERLTIEIIDPIGSEPKIVEATASPDEFDEKKLGALLIELLVDEYDVQATTDGGTLVRMTKHTG